MRSRFTPASSPPIVALAASKDDSKLAEELSMRETAASKSPGDTGKRPPSCSTASFAADARASASSSSGWLPSMINDNSSAPRFPNSMSKADIAQ